MPDQNDQHHHHDQGRDRATRAQTRAREILVNRWGSTDRLLGGNRILHYRMREDQFFLEALQEAFAYQFLSNPALARLCQAQSFLPQHLRSLDQAWRIPVYPPVRGALPVRGAEGLTSNESDMDRRTARRLGLGLQRMFWDLGISSLRRTNYLWVGGPFDPATHRAIEATSKVAQCYSFDGPDGCLDTLLRIGPDGPPLRLITTDPVALLGSLQIHGAALAKLSPNSQLIGWTDLRYTHSDIPKAFSLRRVQFARLADHPLPLAGCSVGNFHLSRLGRILFHPDGSQSYASPIARLGLPLRVALPQTWSWQSGCICGRSSPWTGNNP